MGMTKNHTINQTGINIRKQHSWIFEANLDGFPKLVDGEFVETDVSLIDLTLGLEVRVAREFAKALSATQQNVRSRRLGHGREHEDEDGSRAPQDLPECPAPRLGDDGEPGQQGTCSRSTERRGDPCGECVWEFEEAILCEQQMLVTHT